MEVGAAEWKRLPLQRQVWLACRDVAERKSRHWFDVITRIGRAGMGERTVGMGTDMVNADRAARLGAMQFAASDLIPRLSDQEVAEFRATMILPDWFVPEMLKRAKVIERARRRP
ncbi:MAG TPA: hypothetical protein VHC43_04495 [Mycobacteriales bacterium]|nr:hypothetical protein [Mycobacteriales bacterium]